jgi:curli production assembly/transport component CsgG
MKKLSTILAALLLSGCASVIPPYTPQVDTPSDRPQILPRGYNPLLGIPGPDGPPITVAVYGFTDKTGQRKENDKFSVLSSAVTQGAEVFLIKALQDAGRGKWFQVVERVGLDDLIKERQLIRNQRETYEGKDAKQLAPMLIAGVMIEGGIVGYDTNITSGGAGAQLLGINASDQYRVDVVTVVVRLISVHTGEVLISAGATKTILSAGTNGNVMTFLDQGTTSLQIETGSNVNEPNTYAVRAATEAAVLDMIKQGVTKQLWSYAPPPPKPEAAKPAAAAPATNGAQAPAAPKN